MKESTRFAKAYEPGEFEAEIYAAWEASGAFAPSWHRAAHSDESAPMTGAPEKLFNDKGTEEAFSIVMPPPNANGNLHIGHGLTVALEDSLTRYYRLKGLASWYVPGADHAGFETWVVYERYLESIGHTRFEYTRDELYAQVWDFVEAQRGNMELQLRALGASCSWRDLTFTLDENVIDRVYNTFEKMWNDGMIYRGEKLVNYCPKHQTAFADIEVEHKEEKGRLWEIIYPLTEELNASSSDTLRAALAKSSCSEKEGSTPRYGLVVSTTRPETLFGDAAVAVNPEDERYVELIGKTVELPLTKRAIPIIADEHADPEYGTGAVKITPAHDYDDFEVGERHDLPRIVVIGEDGRMTAAAGVDYEGLTTEECRKKVLADLKEAGLLRGEEKITHAVAHCYKCGTVIEPTLKEQWFIDVEKLAAGAIEHLERGEIKFHPANKKKVLINYLRGLKDWNISRQIPWGIAIPMFRKVDDVVDDAPDWVFDKRTNLTEIEIGGVKYVRDEDTFDTWFSSSHWPIVCTDWMEGKFNPFYPLNVMETGGDILFAWVARMI
ncbi:class I tRNA ligase family protein, partial [Candidatus Saccharibacteria bacterium]|nr:class I tRNA ligase family protein [Candidatus Saccharibacteria bacterium]